MRTNTEFVNKGPECYLLFGIVLYLFSCVSICLPDRLHYDVLRSHSWIVAFSNSSLADIKNVRLSLADEILSPSVARAQIPRIAAVRTSFRLVIKQIGRVKVRIFILLPITVKEPPKSIEIDTAIENKK